MYEPYPLRFESYLKVSYIILCQTTVSPPLCTYPHYLSLIAFGVTVSVKFNPICNTYATVPSFAIVVTVQLTLSQVGRPNKAKEVLKFHEYALFS